MYHFVTLDEEQKIQRRELLDFYGLAAQLSVLVPLVAIAIGNVFQKFLGKSTPDPPSSPRAKAARSLNFSNVQSRWRQVGRVKQAEKYCVECFRETHLIWVSTLA